MGIRKDQERERLRGLLLDGAAFTPTAPADDAYFDLWRVSHAQRHISPWLQEPEGPWPCRGADAALLD